jgi:hypothetical protein
VIAAELMSREANDSVATSSRPLMASTVVRLPVRSLRESCCLGAYSYDFQASVDDIAWRPHGFGRGARCAIRVGTSAVRHQAPGIFGAISSSASGEQCAVGNHRRSCLAWSDLEPMTGIEPAYSAWEADVLPLNYIGNVAWRG